MAPIVFPGLLLKEGRKKGERGEKEGKKEKGMSVYFLLSFQLRFLTSSFFQEFFLKSNLNFSQPEV